MTTVGVIVPYRPSPGRWRVDAMARVERHLRLAFPDAELVIADDGGDPFSRGGSITEAARALDVDVFLVCDADLIVPAEQLLAAVELAREGPGLVIPFSRYLYLTPSQSREITDASDLRLPARPRASWDMNSSVGGAGAFDRHTLEVTGGYPPIFRGWGFEDEAFALLANELAGPTRRIAGDALHLWHPIDPTNQADAPGYQRNLEALARLIAARDAGTLRQALDVDA